MLKILHTIPAMDGGGADRILYDYTVRMLDDIQVDFIVHAEETGILEQDLEQKGCRIFHVPALHKDRKAYFSRVREIIRDGGYDVIHVSQGYRGLVFLYYAWRYGIKTRIAHSHMAFIPESGKVRLIRQVSTFLVKRLATDLFACGNDAAKWMWGRRAFEQGKVHIMTNAIDTARFAFSEEKRRALRGELGLDGKFVIGNVARFSYQKNHEFLIRVFAEIKKRREDAVLLLIGRGELEEEVRQQVVELGLSDAVIFMGVRIDVPDLLNVMDVFLLPSRFEGLGIVYVEAQANGLLCYASKDVVPSEANVCDRMLYLPLSSKPEEWAARIVETDYERENTATEGVKKAGYDIEKESGSLRSFYVACVERDTTNKR